MHPSQCPRKRKARVSLAMRKPSAAARTLSFFMRRPMRRRRGSLKSLKTLVGGCGVSHGRWARGRRIHAHHVALAGGQHRLGHLLEGEGREQVHHKPGAPVLTRYLPRRHVHILAVIQVAWAHKHASVSHACAARRAQGAHRCESTAPGRSRSRCPPPGPAPAHDKLLRQLGAPARSGARSRALMASGMQPSCTAPGGAQDSCSVKAMLQGTIAAL